MRTRRPQLWTEAASFRRPQEGPILKPELLPEGLESMGLIAWQSNGGATRGHPAKSLPFSFEARIPEVQGTLAQVRLLGLFALYCDRENEAEGTLGANLQLSDGKETVFRQDLINGRHYFPSRNLDPVNRTAGDGTSIETVGTVELFGVPRRVDLLTIDIPVGVQADTLRFRDLGSPASFVIFDVFCDFEAAPGCPFHAKSGGVALNELASIVRVGDKVKFHKALDQLELSLKRAEDIDEARGLALTFLAVVTAATLELGGPRSLHRAQLDAARALDKLEDPIEIYDQTRERVEEIASSFFNQPAGPSTHLIDRALSLVERNYAKPLTDSVVAGQLGLSTSHFRYLFRQSTGQPFHKFLIAVRLEKAKQMLLDQELPVSQVAAAVGFTGLSHFSRAFSQRFSVSPTNIRRSGI